MGGTSTWKIFLRDNTRVKGKFGSEVFRPGLSAEYAACKQSPEFARLQARAAAAGLKARRACDDSSAPAGPSQSAASSSAADGIAVTAIVPAAAAPATLALRVNATISSALVALQRQTFYKGRTALRSHVRNAIRECRSAEAQSDQDLNKWAIAKTDALRSPTLSGE